MNTIIPPFDLNRFLQQVSDRIGLLGDLTIDRPVAASHMNAIPREELNAASARHRLNVVRRLGGTVFEFTRRSSQDYGDQDYRFTHFEM